MGYSYFKCCGRATDCALAHRWTDTNGAGLIFGTIMTGADQGANANQYLPYFSTPNLAYMGHILSKNNKYKKCNGIGYCWWVYVPENNAASIKQNICTAMNFQSPVALIELKMTGKQTTHCNANYQIEDIGATTGMPTYTYQWEWSNSISFSPTNIISNNNINTLNITKPYSCSSYYVRVKVTRSDGLFEYAIFQPKLFQAWCSPWCITSLKVPNQGNATIVPNPSNNLISLRFLSENTGRSNFSIIDISGKVIKHYENEVFKGENKLEFDIESLDNGLYYLQIQDVEQNIIEKFIINRKI